MHWTAGLRSRSIFHMTGPPPVMCTVRARFNCMTFRECINVLPKEIQVLPLAEREKVEALLDSGEGKLIVLELERLEVSGRLSSPAFKAALKDLYWSSR